MTLRYIPPDESGAPSTPSQGSPGPLIASLPAEIDVPISAALRELDQILSPPAGYWTNQRAISGLIDLLQMIPANWTGELEAAARWMDALSGLQTKIALPNRTTAEYAFARTKQPILHLATMGTDTHRLWALHLLFAYRAHLTSGNRPDLLRHPYAPALAIRQLLVDSNCLEIDPQDTPICLHQLCIEKRQTLQSAAQEHSAHASSLFLFLVDAPMRKYIGRVIGAGSRRAGTKLSSATGGSPDHHFVRNDQSNRHYGSDIFWLTQSKRRLLRDDLDPFSSVSSACTVLEISETNSLEKLVAKHRTDRRHKVRDYSALPFHMSNLQRDQLRRLDDLVERAIGGDLDDEEETLVTALAIALEFSRPLKAACELQVNPSQKGEFSLVTEPGLRFEIPVIRPSYRRIRECEPGENPIAHRYFLAPSKGLHSLLVRRLERKQGSDGQLFGDPTLAKQVRRYLRRLCHYAPVSPGSVAQFGRNTVASMAGSDKTVAAILFGLDEGLHKTQIFYECKALDELHALHKAYQRVLWASAPCEVRPKADAERVVIALRRNETPRLSIGCSSVPSLKNFRVAIEAEKSALIRVEQILTTTGPIQDAKPDWNKAICFLLHHQATAIGGRTTGDVYIRSSCFNHDHIAYFGDKTDEQGYRVRVLKVPPQTHAQMVWCERWIRSLSTRFGLEPTGLPFLLDPNGNPTRLSARKFELATQSWFPFPSNTPRRVMANLLRDACVSHEAVSFFMGHAQFGREPWRASSAVALNQLFDELDRVVPLILDDLGFSTWWPQ